MKTTVNNKKVSRSTCLEGSVALVVIVNFESMPGAVF